MDHFAMLTRHEQRVDTYCTEVSEGFIKVLWNSPWTTRNSR